MQGGRKATKGRSPDGAKRNPGTNAMPIPDFASLHPGYRSFFTELRTDTLAEPLDRGFGAALAVRDLQRIEADLDHS